MTIEWMLWYGLLGLGTGFLSGMLGVGGGGVLVPVLTMLFKQQGMDTQNALLFALGTAFMCVFVASLSSMQAHKKRGAIDWQAAKGIAIGIVVGSMLFTQIAPLLPPSAIALTFSIFMAFVALQMFLNFKPTPSQTPATFRQLILVGFIIGALSALISVGGAVIVVLYLSYKRVPFATAVGTSSTIMLPIAITGSLGYIISGITGGAQYPYSLGYAYLPAVAAISTASVISAQLGARVAHTVPERTLKRVFGIMCLILGLHMLTSTF